ncbi:glycosyltransferase family 4 protein [Candidatus Bathyarchaeota archaeon]|nr:MAG: glycosyltransferase family 4 protein [Candidatus Bathyarchaeota archaeon]
MLILVKSLYLKARSPGFKLHSYYADFRSHPPSGWRVVAPGESTRRGPGMLRLFHVAVQTSHTFWNFSNLVAPTLEKLAFPFTSRETPLEHYANLTYCSNHVQTKSKKWVADCEHLAALTGYYKPGVAAHWLGRRLQDRSCGGFYCWSNKAVENSKRILRNDFPTNKSHVVYPATSGAANSRNSRDFDGNVRICHMTTHRSSYLENISNFYVKGTRDFLLVLKLLSQVSPRLMRKVTVVIRAWCPRSYIAKLRALGVQIEMIEHPLTRADALSHFANSDLAMLPGHSTPTMAFIEAMSRSVPVIANDVWANSEYLMDGKTGFLIPPSPHVLYCDSDLTPLWYRPDFTHSLVASVDSEYLRRHLRVLEYLLEDENLLLSLKEETGRYFVRSPFEISSRNRELGLLLDKALNQFVS